MNWTVETRDMAKVDVFVAGGGPAGCAAAVAAARRGLKVLLVERQTVLGGTATAGHVAHWLGGRTPGGRWVVGGLFREFVEKAVVCGAAIVPEHPQGKVYQPHAWLPWFIHGVPLDPFRLAAFLERMLREEGVELLYETDVVGVELEESARGAPETVLSDLAGLARDAQETVLFPPRLAAQNKISGVVLHNKGGFFSVPVGAVVDATGDAVVAAFAGCPFEVGRAEDHLTAPASLTFHLDHVDSAALAAAIERDREPKFRPLIAKLKAQGEWPFPYDIFISVQLLEEDVVMINTSRLTEVDGLSATSRTAAYEKGRAEALALLDVFRRHFPGFAAAQLKSVAPMLGVRETRRIVSERTLTVEDVRVGRKFPDTIGFSMYGWDLPDPKRPSVQPLVDESGGKFVNRVQKALATPIPFGVMVPKGVVNLLCPGRAIGVERDVLGPLRVMAPCMAMGEAAGTAMRWLAKGDRVDVETLRETLRGNGCLVDAAALPPIEPRCDP